MASRKSQFDNPESKDGKVACPFCNSTETEMIALFGMQMMTSQYYCHQCNSAFEAVKWDQPDTPRRSVTDTKP